MNPIHKRTPGRPLGKARKRFKEKGFNEDTIAQAVRWARKRPKKLG